MDEIEAKLADWYRKISLEPEHAWLTNRLETITAFAESADIVSIISLGKLFHGNGELNHEFGLAVRSAFKESDSAFKMSENDAEVRMLSGAILLKAADSADEAVSCAALLTICMRPFAGEAPNATPEIINIGRERLRSKRADLRENIFSPLTRATAGSIEQPLAKLSAKLEENTFEGLSESLETCLKVMSQNQLRTNKALNSLIRTHELYREDSQVLWWLVSGWSMEFSVPLSDMNSKAVPMVVAKEFADLTLNFPGPYAAEAVLHRILIDCEFSRENNNPLQFATFINSPEQDWRKEVSQSVCSDLFGLCPILSAVTKSVEVEKKSDWFPAFKNAVGLDPKSEVDAFVFAEQAYNEFVLNKIAK